MLTPEYKIIIVGDGGVGKTSFINHHLDNIFTPKYTPTKGKDIYSITFNTNYGNIIFNISDTGGKEKYNGLFNGYYEQVNGAIIMFDTKLSFRSVDKWIADIKNITGEIPISIYKTKSDIQNGINYQNYISVKNNINLDIPFLNLARQLMNHEDLVFL